MPKRIQRSRAKGWRMPENTVYVGRGTPHGNPFPVTKAYSTSCGVTEPIWSVGTWNGPALWFASSADEARSIAVRAYREWINLPMRKTLRDRVRSELRGKDLACWCPIGSPCHADVLLEIANGFVCEES